MRKLIIIFLSLLASIASMAQFEAGEYINADTMKKDGVSLYVDHLKMQNPLDSGNVATNQKNIVGWEPPKNILLRAMYTISNTDSSFFQILQNVWEDNREVLTSIIDISISEMFREQYSLSNIYMRSDTVFIEQGDSLLFFRINEVDPYYSTDSSLIQAQLRDWLYSTARTISATDKTAWNNQFTAVTSPFYIPGGAQGIEFYFKNRANQTVGTITLTPANLVYPGLMSTDQYQLLRDWAYSVAYNITQSDTTRWGTKYWSLEPDSINLLPIDTVGNSVFRLNLKQTGARFQSTGPQLHLDYNDSTYTAVITDSAGVLNVVPSGGIFSVAGHINMEGGLYQRGRRINFDSLTVLEVDPVFTASPASGVTSGLISNWNSAYASRISTATAPLKLFSNTISLDFKSLTNEDNLTISDTILVFDASANMFKKSKLANVVNLVPLSTKMSITNYDFDYDNIVDDAEKLGGVAASGYVTLNGTQSLTNKTVNGVVLTAAGAGTNFLSADGTYKSISAGATNLTTSYSTTSVTINSDTGTDAAISSATTSQAGVMSSSDKAKFDKIKDPTPQSITTSASCATYCNFYTTASSNKTITFSNLLDGLTGNIEVAYSGASVLTFAASGYTIVIAPAIHNTGDTVISQSSGRSVYSYWVRGTYIYINGTQLYR